MYFLGPKPATLIAILMLSLSAASTSGSENQVARNTEGQRYHASVGLVTLGSYQGDFWSDPDIRVEIRRHDRAVTEQIVELADKIDRMNSDAKELEDLRAPILEKQRLSELQTGPKLTDDETIQLATLAEKSNTTWEEDRDLRVLTEKKEKSEQIPGPPLSDDESAELDRLNSALRELRAAIAQERRSLSALRVKVVGYTKQISTKEKYVHFGWPYILTVYEDDILLVKVVDVDATEDDVFSEYTIRVSAELLASSAIHELGPTFDRGLRGLQIQFVAAED